MEKINLCWARLGAERNFVNFGDALSPIIVAGLSNMKVRYIDQDINYYSKLSAIGTIGQNLKNGESDVWGSGFDATINPDSREVKRYHLPSNTHLNVLATRGRFSELLLNSQGVSTQGVYGDPGWFAKYLVPEDVDKKYELGIIVHISELEKQALDSVTKEAYKRYLISGDLKKEIKVINTYAKDSIDGVLNKIREIKSCKRILSTSLHGLIMAEMFDIPSAWFGFSKTQGIKTPLYVYDPVYPLDHRFRDFYSGTSSHDYVLTYHSPRNESCDYSKAIDFLDKEWKPVEFNEIPLFKSFPYLDIAHPSLMSIDFIRGNLKDVQL